MKIWQYDWIIARLPTT